MKSTDNSNNNNISNNNNNSKNRCEALRIQSKSFFSLQKKFQGQKKSGRSLQRLICAAKAKFTTYLDIKIHLGEKRKGNGMKRNCDKSWQLIHFHTNNNNTECTRDSGIHSWIMQSVPELWTELWESNRDGHFCVTFEVVSMGFFVQLGNLGSQIRKCPFLKHFYACTACS